MYETAVRNRKAAGFVIQASTASFRKAAEAQRHAFGSIGVDQSALID